MYRAFVGGRWLPWVSNADPQWMQNVKNKFSLDGTLITGYYAGLDGQNISGLEIHVFEDSSSNPGSGDFRSQKFVWQPAICSTIYQTGIHLIKQ